MGYAGHGWGMGFSIWCIMIVLGFILFYFLKTSTKNTEGHSSAQDILDRRYANGEINKEEYEEKSNTLKRIA
ncbi:SHOCT domain-containing protein [Sulfurovum sp.]|uniref:SHOCT domain-containing protein n=1 Tax=Sulfurovum sp. TaxID=1969726 RepID=UPI003568F277